MIDNEITLRPIEERDAENIVRWRNADSVRKNLFNQEPITVDQHLRYYRNTVCTGKCRQFIIELNEEVGLDIGTVFLKNIDLLQRQAEFGIFIGEPAGKGRRCALPATEGILRVAFEEMGLERVYLYVVEDNVPAIRTYKHAGFSENAREHGRFIREGKPLDVIAMEIRSNTWRRLHNE